MGTKKTKVAIIGTGNIGIDLLKKLQRSQILECGMFAGRNEDSIGIKIAREMGVPTSTDSINAITQNPDCCQIVFDATSASAHFKHYEILKKLGKFSIDLTPSRVGKMCCPVLNLDDCMGCDDVNMITCGGQATVPLINAIHEATDGIKYVEIVATIASKSAGIGTRNNIDEFTQTTKDAIIEFTGVKNAKAIIVLNPAEPPITMHNTIYVLAENPDMEKIRDAVKKMEEKIREYVPGYKVVTEPVYENGRVTTTLQVVGLGDYLPKYSGNLDIITCAAIKTAESYAKKNQEAR